MKRTLSLLLSLASSSALADSNQSNPLYDGLNQLKDYGLISSLRLRHESFNQDNDLKNADALTLRSTIGYKTRSFRGFHGLIEVEDSRPVFGGDEYFDGVNDKIEYSKIADPESTEIDQAYAAFEHDMIYAQLGRTYIRRGNIRFVDNGHWRQDRQAYDAAILTLTLPENVELYYGYINQRLGTTADESDIDSRDHLAEAIWSTDDINLKGYYYRFEDEDNKGASSTWGARLEGTFTIKALNVPYEAEFAYQTNKETDSTYRMPYLHVSGSVQQEFLSAKLGWEYLGSDNGDKGFSTPIGANHRYNGWADIFGGVKPNEGLSDFYASLFGEMPVIGGDWVVTYHHFSPIEDTSEVEDFGNEFDFLYTYPIKPFFTLNAKAAIYRSDDSSNGTVDSEKFWLYATFIL